MASVMPDQQLPS